MRYELIVLAVAMAATPSTAQQRTGAIAGNFRLADADGRAVQLADYRGRTVVLEWNNPGCPFVQKHYNSGNMQRTQAAARGQGAVWLTINSGAPGKQGHMTGKEAKAFVAGAQAKPDAYLLDPAGRVGRGYAAKKTPHLYVIDPAGKLVYQGAIDSKATANPADIASAQNYVLAALEDLRANRTVRTAETRPYGCTVKYAD